LQLVSFIPLIKKGNNFLIAKKINTTRAKIIATTAPNASVARTF